MGAISWEDGNLLPNPSFETGWYHMGGRPEYQIPFGWTALVHTVGDYNFVEPEIRVLPISQLPEHEQDLFVLDGEYTVKSFKGHGAVAYVFDTSDGIDVEAGWYKVSIPVYADIVWKYVDGEKVYPDDPNSCHLSISIDGEPVAWMNPEFGAWNTVEYTFFVNEPAYLRVGLAVVCPFPMRNNGLFIDSVSMVRGEGDTRSYSREIHLLPQDATNEEVNSVVAIATPERQSVSFSADDAFIRHENMSGLTVHVWDVSRVGTSKDELEDWVNTFYPPLPEIIYEDF